MLETTAEACELYVDELTEVRERTREWISDAAEREQTDCSAPDAVIGDVASLLVGGVANV